MFNVTCVYFNMEKWKDYKLNENNTTKTVNNFIYKNIRS